MGIFKNVISPKNRVFRSPKLLGFLFWTWKRCCILMNTLPSWARSRLSAPRARATHFQPPVMDGDARWLVATSSSPTLWGSAVRNLFRLSVGRIIAGGRRHPVAIKINKRIERQTRDAPAQSSRRRKPATLEIIINWHFILISKCISLPVGI